MTQRCASATKLQIHFRTDLVAVGPISGRLSTHQTNSRAGFVLRRREMVLQQHQRMSFSANMLDYDKNFSITQPTFRSFLWTTFRAGRGHPIAPASLTSEGTIQHSLRSGIPPSTAILCEMGLLYSRSGVSLASLASCSASTGARGNIRVFITTGCSVSIDEGCDCCKCE